MLWRFQLKWSGKRDWEGKKKCGFFTCPVAYKNAKYLLLAHLHDQDNGKSLLKVKNWSVVTWPSIVLTWGPLHGFSPSFVVYRNTKKGAGRPSMIWEGRRAVAFDYLTWEVVENKRKMLCRVMAISCWGLDGLFKLLLFSLCSPPSCHKRINLT